MTRWRVLVVLVWLLPPTIRAQAVRQADWPRLEGETLRHFQALLRFDTSYPPRDEVLATDYLKQVFEREGIAVQIFASDPKRPNLVAPLKGHGMRILARGCCAVRPVAMSNDNALATEQSCERLTALTLPHTTITLAQSVPAGQFRLPVGAPTPPGTPPTPRFDDLPAFCRVAATLTPSSDSDIKIEVWLPTSGWNGKFEAVGNGGWWGDIRYATLPPAVDGLSKALRRGYAATSTDTGHVGGSGGFALGHPEKLTDFAYRAVHEMTLQAKNIMTAFYGRGPRRSYWNGCSSGGKQGLKEAQRFPDDYDGIVAGAPANYWTHLMGRGLIDPVRDVPKEKYELVHKAVLDACDALDGVRDGVLENPTSCHFDPRTLQCAGDDGPTCLTALQVDTITKVYSPSKNRGTLKQIFPGLARGSELGWGALAGLTSLPEDHFRYVVFKDANWTVRGFDIDRDLASADTQDNGTINAMDPNLSAFVGRGGKLLMYHGWSDALIAPQNSIDYYKSVVEAMGPSKTKRSVRLFMVPGMGHCGGGEGTSSFDPMSAIEQWAERGKAPTQMTASHLTNGLVDRTRPLCPYPEIAQYQGTGSTDNAAHFVCRKR
jgi:feruloyl esterase